MQISQEQFNEWLLNNPVLAKRNPEINLGGICSKKPKHIKGKTLERDAAGEKESVKGAAESAGSGRFRIVFQVWSMRAADWDNYGGAGGLKQLQDGLVKAGFLPGDSYDVLEGALISHKATIKEEERTEITIYRL